MIYPVYTRVVIGPHAGLSAALSVIPDAKAYYELSAM